MQDCHELRCKFWDLEFICLFIFGWDGKGVEASVDGVLGGYGQVNDADVKGSEAFLQTLLSELFVDGGIGRHLVALGTLFFYAHIL